MKALIQCFLGPEVARELEEYLQQKEHAHGKLPKYLPTSGDRVEIAKIFRSTNRTEKIEVKNKIK